MASALTVKPDRSNRNRRDTPSIAIAMGGELHAIFDADGNETTLNTEHVAAITDETAKAYAGQARTGNREKAFLGGYRCPSCGFENEPGMKFCGNCGTKL